MTTLSNQPTHHGYAVNVKDHTLYNNHETGPLSEDEVQAVYDAKAEYFWGLVQEVATDHGFDGAYSEAVKAAEREPVERAYWESRDVCTVDA